MKHYAILLLSAILLTACEPQQPQQPKEVTYIMPPELSDCKVHAIDSSNGPKLYVVRCSGQGKKTETSVEWSQSSGKTTTYYHTILIDGAEYVKKDEKAPVVNVNGAEYVKAAK